MLVVNACVHLKEQFVIAKLVLLSLSLSVELVTFWLPKIPDAVMNLNAVSVWFIKMFILLPAHTAHCIVLPIHMTYDLLFKSNFSCYENLYFRSCYIVHRMKNVLIYYSVFLFLCNI